MSCLHESRFNNLMYSVMQPYRNSFCVDVVLDNLNTISRDEGSILDEIYAKKIYSNLYHKDLIIKQ